MPKKGNQCIWIKDREENSMSTTYEIYKFAKPTLKELSIVDYYSFKVGFANL